MFKCRLVGEVGQAQREQAARWLERCVGLVEADGSARGDQGPSSIDYMQAAVDRLRGSFVMNMPSSANQHCGTLLPPHTFTPAPA